MAKDMRQAKLNHISREKHFTRDVEKRLTKSRLAIILSKVKTFEKPKVREEQYTTDSELAATILWEAYMHGDIDGKIVADLGCGTGILGIGALLLGAKKVFFVDKDDEALTIAKQNLDEIKAEHSTQGEIIVECKDIRLFDDKVDVVIENPPFGTKQKHADRGFLEKAFEISDSIYSIHKITSKEFIDGISRKNNFKINSIHEYAMPLKASYEFHKKQIEQIIVGIWHLEKKQ